jgi:hypothetical protein
MHADLVPVKADVQSVEEESRVVILMPRYPTIAGRLVGKLFHRSRYIKVRLDGIGSETWRLIDGKRTICEIGSKLHDVFGNDTEPLYPRLVEFLNILLRNRFIMTSETCEVKNVD